MSCSWDVFCKTCGVKCGITDANHELDLMRELVDHRHAVASIAPLINDTRLTLGPWGNNGPFGIDPSWFAKHHEHELVPMSEYGDVPEETCEHWRCGKRGELRQLRVDQKIWLLCDECRGIVTDLVSDEIERSHQDDD